MRFDPPDPSSPDDRLYGETPVHLEAIAGGHTWSIWHGNGAAIAPHSRFLSNETNLFGGKGPDSNADEGAVMLPGHEVAPDGCRSVEAAHKSGSPEQ